MKQTRALGQYAVLRQFKAPVVAQLRIVSLPCPTANVAVTDDGLRLRPSPTPVARQTVLDV